MQEDECNLFNMTRGLGPGGIDASRTSSEGADCFYGPPLWLQTTLPAALRDAIPDINPTDQVSLGAFSAFGPRTLNWGKALSREVD